MDSEKRRLVHLIEFFKDLNDVWESIIALLSLNVSTEEIYQVTVSVLNHPKQRKALKIYDQVESKLS